MQFTHFTQGTQYSIGAELELRLLHSEDLTLANEFDYLQSQLNDEYKNNIAPEYLKSLVEINTPVYSHPKGISEYIKQCVNYMQTIMDKKSILLATSGSYTLACENVEISAKERYAELYEEHQILLDNFTICGYHIHIGFEDFEAALRAYNYSIQYLPFLVALSASSVFFNEENSGIDSYRTKIFDRLAKASVPEYFESYEEIKALYDLLEKCGVIQSQKDIWWDIRIQPELKTLEFRVCDAVSDYDRLEVIAALTQAICRLSEVEMFKKVPMQILKQNMWSAARYSMEGEIILDGACCSIKEALGTLVGKLKSKGFLDAQSIEKVEKYIKMDSIAKRMKQVYKETKSMKEVEKLGIFK